MRIAERLDFSWTDVPVPELSVSDLVPEAIWGFKKMGLETGRLTQYESDMPAEELLGKLGLMVDGVLTRAAVLLFHANPCRALHTSLLKIGMFDGNNLLYFDDFDEPLIFLPNNVMKALDTRYVVRKVSYDGINRVELNPYPRSAMREAIINAIVHNDYSIRAPIQIKVYEDRLFIHNAGSLPVGWSVDELKQSHMSIPRNGSLAKAFFRAGLIESFGRGIDTIMSEYKDKKRLEPIFNSKGSFSIMFKHMYEYPLSELDSNEMSHEDEKLSVDVVVLNYLRDNGGSTYSEISAQTGLSIRQLYRVINKHVVDGNIIKEKRGKSVIVSLPKTSQL